MRKLFTLLLIVVLLPLITPLTLAASETNPAEIALMAGKNTQVGNVLVWNDATNLYVKYLITEPGWYLMETHLAVQPGKFTVKNPAPGQFPYNDVYSPPVTASDIYTIPLNGVTSFHIAAHAVVGTATTGQMVVASDVNTRWFNSTKPLAEQAFEPVKLAWSHPSWPPIAGASWIWIEENTNPDWEYGLVPAEGWLFQRTITLPVGAFDITTNALTANGDNAYRAWLNGVALGGDGVMDKNDPNHGAWSTVLNHAIPAGTVVAGNNLLEFRAMNYYWSGTPDPSGMGSGTANPAGLIYKMTVDYKTITATETAWGQGTRFSEKGSWAMHFTYDCTDNAPVCVETINVPTNAGQGVTSTSVLDPSKTYILEASGTWSFCPSWNPRGIADAGFSQRADQYANLPTGLTDGWSANLFGGSVNNYLELWWKQSSVSAFNTFVNDDPSSFNAEHVYTKTINGVSGTLDFKILDDYYGDNTGYLTVRILEVV